MARDTDYAALNREYTAQKRALTRAVNTKDPELVKNACRAAVAAWNDHFDGWPDDWSAWQRALDDVLPWQDQISLDAL